MKKSIPYLIIAILVLVIILMLRKKAQDRFFPITITIPSVFHQFDTIKSPAEVIKLPGQVKIDSTYYNKYVELLTNKKKDSLYKDAVTLREYQEVFEDSIITIKTFSETRGWLTKHSLSYETKERNVTTELPIPSKYHLFVGGGVGVPMEDNSSVQPLYQAGFIFQNKKGNLLNLETDHKLERVYVKYYYRF